jgi:hypothetical protein
MARTLRSYDVDLVASVSQAPCTVEPEDGYCGHASAGQWDPARPVLDHYVGCLTTDAEAAWIPAFDRLLAAYHGAPASEAAGPLDAAIRRRHAHPDGAPVEALEFLERIRDACIAHPSGQLTVADSTTDQADHRDGTTP